MTCHFLAQALQREAGLAVVGSAVSGPGLLQAIEQNPCDVLLLNVHLQEGARSGLALLEQIRSRFPQLRTILLVDRSEPQLVIEAFRAGARGIFSRSISEPLILHKAISRVHEGQVWADSEQLTLVLEAFSGPPPATKTKPAGPAALSPRERAVAKLVAEGFPNRDIARQLQLSDHTVKNYIFRIFEKLGLANRVELVLYAITHLSEDQA